jgi:drug/metabolite transporter (DMT)-like permease
MGMNAPANVLFIRSVHLSPLSRTVPFLSLTPVFAAVVAIPLLGEVPGIIHCAGIVMVVVGAVVLNSDLADSWWRSISHEKGVPYMIAVAVLWAFSIALDKRALGHASPAAHAFLLSVGSATLVLAWILYRGKLSELRAVRSVPRALLAGLIGFAVAALALQMLALQWLWVAVVETLKRAFDVVASVVFGRLFFGEPITGRKVVAMGLMVAGTALMALT